MRVVKGNMRVDLSCGGYCLESLSVNCPRHVSCDDFLNPVATGFCTDDGTAVFTVCPLLSAGWIRGGHGGGLQELA
jgi:hypothetical protein